MESSVGDGEAVAVAVAVAAAYTPYTPYTSYTSYTSQDRNRDSDKYANIRHMHIKCVRRDSCDSAYVAPHLWLAN